LEFLKKSLDIHIKTVGKKQPDVSILLSTLGKLYTIKQNYSDALESLLQALTIDSTIYGEETLSVADILYNIGALHKKLCNTALSLDYYKRALTIRERYIIQFPRLVASVVNNIGALLNIMGLHNEAAANCSRAQMLYEIRDTNRNINPKEDKSAYLTLEMAEVLQNLGCIYYNMKKL